MREPYAPLSVRQLTPGKGKAVKKWISKPEEIMVVGTWNGEDSGPIFDWLNDNGFAYTIQTETDQSFEARTEVELAKGEEGKEVTRRTCLAVLGKNLYQNVTVEVGADLALREFGNGEPHLTELYEGYLETNYIEAAE
jgi:hypothetical protein